MILLLLFTSKLKCPYSDPRKAHPCKKTCHLSNKTAKISSRVPARSVPQKSTTNQPNQDKNKSHNSEIFHVCGKNPHSKWADVCDVITRVKFKDEN